MVKIFTRNITELKFKKPVVTNELLIRNIILAVNAIISTTMK